MKNKLNAIIQLIAIILILNGCGGGGGGSEGQQTDEQSTSSGDQSTDNQPESNTAHPRYQWSVDYSINSQDEFGNEGYIEVRTWNLSTSRGGHVRTSWALILDSVDGKPKDIRTAHKAPNMSWNQPTTIYTGTSNDLGSLIETDGEGNAVMVTNLNHTTNHITGEEPIYHFYSATGDWVETTQRVRALNNNDRALQMNEDGTILFSIADSNVFEENRDVKILYSTSLSNTYLEETAYSSNNRLNVSTGSLILDEKGAVHAFFLNTKSTEKRPRPTDDPITVYTDSIMGRKRDVNGIWQTEEVYNLEFDSDREISKLVSDVSPSGNNTVLVWIESNTGDIVGLGYDIKAMVSIAGVWSTPVVLLHRENKDYDDNLPYGGLLKTVIDDNGNAAVVHNNVDNQLYVQTYAHGNGWSTIYKPKATINGASSLDTEAQETDANIHDLGSGRFALIFKEIFPDVNGYNFQMLSSIIYDESLGGWSTASKIAEVLPGTTKIRGITPSWKSGTDDNGKIYVLWGYDNSSNIGEGYRTELLRVSVLSLQ